MDRATGRAAYRAARDLLVRHRDDHAAMVAQFCGPDVGDRFNWVLDWFDPIAAGHPRTAPRIIGDDGTDESYSFAEMVTRSDRLATSLAGCDVAPGDRVMAILGNQVELRESMLALMKLGAVIMPTTIFAHALRSLVRYQRIRCIEFVELPKTISGKIRRVELRARENSCQPVVSAREHHDR
jgi:acetyl-CoA synthetase